MPPDVEEKLYRYMDAIKETNRSKALNKALEAGVDYLESIGWDASKELARRIASKTTALSSVPPTKVPLKSIPNVSSPRGTKAQ